MFRGKNKLSYIFKSGSEFIPFVDKVSVCLDLIIIFLIIIIFYKKGKDEDEDGDKYKNKYKYKYNKIKYNRKIYLFNKNI